MIRLNVAPNPSTPPAARLAPGIPGQGGAFELALASQQHDAPAGEPGATAAAMGAGDRQDLAVGGSDLPQAAIGSSAVLAHAIDPALALGAQPDWRFALQTNDDSAGAPSDEGDTAADDENHTRPGGDDAAMASGSPAPQPLPITVAPIAQPISQPAAEATADAAADETAAANASPVQQAGRGTRIRSQLEAADSATPAASEAAAAIGTVPPADKAIAPLAPLAPDAKPPVAELPASVVAKIEAPAKPAVAASQVAAAGAPQPNQPQHNTLHSTMVASLAADALPLRPTPSADRRHVVDLLDGIAAGSIGATGTITAHAVQPNGDSQQPTLDLGRQDWMASMIDQIETLRDVDGARTARIRLNPDAMGTVDVSIRHDGDAVHVHFASDTPATRTLLGDAAPALAQLAEQRGIRLSQASVDAGAGQAGNQQRQDAQQPQRAAAPAPASAQAAEAGATDDRIA